MVSRYELALEKIAKLELLLKESRESTEFWRSEALRLEKELAEADREVFDLIHRADFDLS